MSEIHVLDGDGSNYRVVMHFAVPVGNNAAGVTWSDAVAGSAGLNEDGSPAIPKTVLRIIDAAEKVAIQGGTVYEHVGTFPIESGGIDGAELQASHRHFYAQEKAKITQMLRAKLRYFGHTESEA